MKIVSVKSGDWHDPEVMVEMKERWLTPTVHFYCSECNATYFPPKLKGPMEVKCSCCGATLVTLEGTDSWIAFERSKVRRTRDMKYSGTIGAKENAKTSKRQDAPNKKEKK